MFKYKIGISLAIFASMATALFLTTGCKKDKETAEENITTVEVHLTGAGFDKKFYWNDPDGDGGAAPVIDPIKIAPNVTNLRCHLHVYDRSKTPEIDITEEIEAESNDHLFVFTTTGANLTVAYDDKDQNNQNFGLITKWASGAASKGKIRIRLFHEPTDKNNTNAPGGEVDFDIEMPVTIE
jgi:hypothetical protein